MRLSGVWFGLWLVVFTSVFLDAQDSQGYNYAYYNFSKADGLPESNIADFTQDKRGFIYAGTGSGLYRHNGNRWEHLKSPLDRPTESIGSYAVITKYNPYEDLIYIISITDCQTYNPNSGEFKRIKKNNSFNDVVKISLFFDPKIGTLINSTKGIWLVKDQTIVPWPVPENWPKENYATVINIVKIDNYRIAICAIDRLGIFDQKSGTFSDYPNKTGVLSRKGILDRKRNRLWFVSLPKLVYFDLSNQTFAIEHRSLSMNECRDIILTDSDQLWTSSGGFFDIEKGQWTFIPYIDGKYSNAIQYWPSLFIDQEKNQWCGSSGFGANVLFSTNKWVKNIYLGNEKTNYEPTAKAIDGDHVFIANSTNGEITKINAKTGISTPLKMPVAGPVYEIQLYQDELIGISPTQVFKYNIRTNKGSIIDISDRNKLGDFEYLQCSKDQIIVGNNKGFFVHDLTSKSTKLINLSDQPLGLIYSSYKDTIDKAIYIIGVQNIARYDIKSGGVSYPFYDMSTQRLRTPNPVAMLRFGGALWMISTSDGLYKVDPKTFQLKQYTKEKSFFSSNFLNNIIADGEHLWLGTIETLHLFDPKEERVIMSIDRQRGMKRDDTSHGLAKAKDHIIKLNYASVDILDRRMHANVIDQQPIYIIHCVINGHEKCKVPMGYDTTFVMNEKDANIELEYSLPIYTNFQHHSFSYRLLGMDTAWHHTYDRQVKYNRLPVGDYTLEIKAWTSNGVKINHTRKIHFIVQPLFYKTWWFLSLIGLFLAGFIYLVYKIRLDKVRTELTLKSKYEQQISALEMKALRAQMNPHFVFNSLNSIQKFIFEKDEYAASQYLTKFSRLIRMILDQSNQEFITIGNEMEMLKYYIDMERLRFSNKFNYEINKSPDVSENWTIPSMVIQPHVENAIWHGLMHKTEDCKLSVNFEGDEQGFVKVTIEDNGVGREMAEKMKSKQTLKKKSFGSHISQDRIKYFAQMTGKKTRFDIIDLFHPDGTPAGTKIVLLLPVL